MTRYYATVTKRGQVTIPAEIRRLLGVGTGEQMVFLVEGNEVRLEPAKAVFRGRPWPLHDGHTPGSGAPPRSVAI